MATVLPPVIVGPDQTEARARVGDVVVFSVDSPASTTLVSDSPLVSMAQGTWSGQALLNPGLTALGPGSATVTVTSPSGSRFVVVMIDA